MQEIQIADIHEELTRLWREAAAPAATQPGAEPGAPPLMRATTLNLVVAGCGAEREALEEILLESTARHPCRAIVVHPDEAAERAGPRAWVSIMCHAGGPGQPQVCSELLVLSGPAENLHELVAAVAGLLVADLPTFLWWRGRLPESTAEMERFRHLAGAADRVLFDSLGFGTEQQRRLAEFRLRLGRAAMGDLNWARLTPWRSAVTQQFDAPAAGSLLSGLRSVRVEYAGTPGQPVNAAARLLAGWLKSRLGDSFVVQFRTATEEAVELQLAGETLRVARPPVPATGVALAEELRVLGRDAVFEEALAAAVEFQG